MKKEMDLDMFISRRSRHYPFVENTIKLLFSICYLIWRVNIYVSRQGKV